MNANAPPAAAESAPAAVLPLSALSRRFVLHWGEMGSRWGVNRTVAQIHALLFLAGRPLHAEEIAATLAIARSNASTSLRELMNLKLVRLVHQLGDRRDHFETDADPWSLCRTIVRERKRREFDPTVRMLEQCIASPDLGYEEPATQKRIRDTLSLMRQVSGWVDELVELEPPTLAKLMKLGGKVGALIGAGKAKAK